MADPDRPSRFEREVEVLASLNHPNIGGIYGLEEAEGQKALGVGVGRRVGTARARRDIVRLLRFVGVSVAVSLSLGIAQRSAATCEAVGEVHFICGVISPEDLAIVPGAEWIIASGDQEGGRIQLVNVQDKTATLLFQTPTRGGKGDSTVARSDPRSEGGRRVGFPA